MAKIRGRNIPGKFEIQRDGDTFRIRALREGIVVSDKQLYEGLEEVLDPGASILVMDPETEKTTHRYDFRVGPGGRAVLRARKAPRGSLAGYFLSRVLLWALLALGVFLTYLSLRGLT